MMLFIFGEVLFDCFNDDRLLGGAPFNLVNHLQKYGHVPFLFSAVGRDADGDRVLSFMKEHSLSTEYIQLVNGKMTGVVHVTLDHKDSPQYEILEDVAFDYIKWVDQLEKEFFNNVEFFYYGTLAQRHDVSRETLRQCLNICQQKSIHTLCDLNLRKPFYDRDLIDFSIAHCTDLKISDEEFLELNHLYEVDDLPDYLFSENCQLQRIWVTRGDEGAECIPREGDIIYQQADKITNLVSTVGAGDSFTSVIIDGLITGKNINQILKAGVSYAAAICQKKGAF